jgi:hypothetical protein
VPGQDRIASYTHDDIELSLNAITATDITLGPHAIALDSSSNLKKSKDTRKIKTKRTEARNSGKLYETSRGKKVLKKVCKPLASCRMKCKDRLNCEQQTKLFDHYWGIGNYVERVAHIAQSIIIKKKAITTFDEEVPVSKRKQRNITVDYFFQIYECVGRTKVCKNCFLLTLCETKAFIESVISKKILCYSNDNISVNNYRDERGRYPRNS